MIIGFTQRFYILFHESWFQSMKSWFDSIFHGLVEQIVLLVVVSMGL